MTTRFSGIEGEPHGLQGGEYVEGAEVTAHLTVQTLVEDPELGLLAETSIPAWKWSQTVTTIPNGQEVMLMNLAYIPLNMFGTELAGRLWAASVTQDPETIYFSSAPHLLSMAATFNPTAQTPEQLNLRGLKALDIWGEVENC